MPPTLAMPTLDCKSLPNIAIHNENHMNPSVFTNAVVAKSFAPQTIILAFEFHPAILLQISVERPMIAVVEAERIALLLGVARSSTRAEYAARQYIASIKMIFSHLFISFV